MPAKDNQGAMYNDIVCWVMLVEQKSVLATQPFGKKTAATTRTVGSLSCLSEKSCP